MSLGCKGNLILRLTVLPAGVHFHCKPSMLNLEDLMQAKLAGVGFGLQTLWFVAVNLKHWDTLKVPLVSSLNSCSCWNQLQLEQDFLA